MIESCTDVRPPPSQGAASRAENGAGFRQAAGPRRQLGKTCLMAVQGGEVTAGAGRAAGKHPLLISPSRVWFALYSLCRAG